MNEIDFKIIGKKIRERRKSLNITQEQLADFLEVNPSHISNIESGRAHPSLIALVNISNYLSCSIDAFISHEYTFMNSDNTDNEILMKLKTTDEIKKQKMIKIINLL